MSKVFTKSQEKQFTTKMIFKYIQMRIYLDAVQFKTGNQLLKRGNRLFHSFAPLYPKDRFRYSVFGFGRVRSVQLFRKLYEV